MMNRVQSAELSAKFKVQSAKLEESPMAGLMTGRKPIPQDFLIFALPDQRRCSGG
jgi:hypothetical protein